MLAVPTPVVSVTKDSQHGFCFAGGWSQVWKVLLIIVDLPGHYTKEMPLGSFSILTDTLGPHILSIRFAITFVDCLMTNYEYKHTAVIKTNR